MTFSAVKARNAYMNNSHWWPYMYIPTSLTTVYCKLYPKDRASCFELDTKTAVYLLARIEKAEDLTSLQCSVFSSMAITFATAMYVTYPIAGCLYSAN